MGLARGGGGGGGGEEGGEAEVGGVSACCVGSGGTGEWEGAKERLGWTYGRKLQAEAGRWETRVKISEMRRCCTLVSCIGC